MTKMDRRTFLKIFAAGAIAGAAGISLVDRLSGGHELLRGLDNKVYQTEIPGYDVTISKDNESYGADMVILKKKDDNLSPNDPTVINAYFGNSGLDIITVFNKDGSSIGFKTTCLNKNLKAEDCRYSIFPTMSEDIHVEGYPSIPTTQKYFGDILGKVEAAVNNAQKLIK